MRMVYLAYPIDSFGLTQDQVADLIVIKQMLHEFGVDLVYDPGDAFSLRQGAVPGDEIDWCNRRAANKADGLFAYLPRAVASIGVPIEVDRALAQGKWVALCSDAESWMLQDQRRGLARFDVDRGSMVVAARWLADQSEPVYADRDNEVQPLPVQLLGETSALPSRGYRDDAGLDLRVSEDTYIPAGVSCDVPCGIAIELPYWSWGLIIGRSSTRRTRGLLVHPGVIDAGWRGPIFTLVENLSDEPVRIKAGERLGQLIVMANSTRRVEPREAHALSPSARGTHGFGSTGF